jgi:hypothetical protein
MAQLYTLLGGKSKEKTHTRIMTSTLKKCENHKRELERSAKAAYPSGRFKWFVIREAEEDEKEYVRSNSNKWTGYQRVGVPATKQRNPKN